MSLIKKEDKFKSRTGGLRSNFNQPNKLTIPSDNSTTNKVNELSKSTRVKNVVKEKSISSGGTTIEGCLIPINNYKLITSLEKGFTLIDIKITVTAKSGSNAYLYWTNLEGSKLTITKDASDQTLSDSKDSLRLLSYIEDDMFNYSLRGNNSTTQFVNVKENIYFYISTELLTDVTILKQKHDKLRQT